MVECAENQLQSFSVCCSGWTKWVTEELPWLWLKQMREDGSSQPGHLRSGQNSIYDPILIILTSDCSIIILLQKSLKRVLISFSLSSVRNSQIASVSRFPFFISKFSISSEISNIQSLAYIFPAFQIAVTYTFKL